MQVVVDNSSGELMPGRLRQHPHRAAGSRTGAVDPGGALIFGQKGLRVATVDANSKVMLKSVTIARDLGQVVELSTGIVADDRVIESPPDGLNDGDEVRVVKGPGAIKQSAQARE